MFKSILFLIFDVIRIMKKLFVIIICLFSLSANAIEKKTTFDKDLFDKAQSDGKISKIINQDIKLLDNLINIFIKTSKNNSYFHWGAKGKKGSVSIKKTKECLVVSELI